MMRVVLSGEEEWRTKPLNGWTRRSRGRACLWLKLACGHYEQRMASVQRDGSVKYPKKVRCHECATSVDERS